jgi:hypothetical protein
MLWLSAWKRGLQCVPAGLDRRSFSPLLQGLAVHRQQLRSRLRAQQRLFLQSQAAVPATRPSKTHAFDELYAFCVSRLARGTPPSARPVAWTIDAVQCEEQHARCVELMAALRRANQPPNTALMMRMWQRAAAIGSSGAVDRMLDVLSRPADTQYAFVVDGACMAQRIAALLRADHERLLRFVYIAHWGYGVDL